MKWNNDQEASVMRAQLPRLVTVGFLCLAGAPAAKAQAGTTCGLQEDFENGAPKWTLGGLAHVVANSNCPAPEPGFSSASNAVYIGQDASCSYDTGAGVGGSLLSPPIFGIDASSVLSFAYLRDVEFFLGGSFDVLRIDVMTGPDRHPTQVWSLDSSTPSSSVWKVSGDISLAAFENQVIQVLFSFDSFDGIDNDHVGWLIDDVVITGASSCPVAIVLEPADGSIFDAGSLITFGGAAADTEDGDLTESLAWSSDLDGVIGTGGSFSTNTLSVGAHTITASVVDSNGLSASDSISAVVTTSEELIFDGFEHSPVGEARAFVSSRVLKILNIGSSGNDGVAIGPGDAEGFKLTLVDVPDPADVVDGTFHEMSTTHGDPSQTTAIRHEYRGGSIHIAADFESLAPDARAVDVFLGGELVASLEHMEEFDLKVVQEAGIRVVCWEEICSSNGSDFPVDGTITYVSGPTIRGGSGSAASIAVELPDGSIVRGDRFRFRPVGGNRPDAMSSVTVVGADLPSISVSQEAIEKFAIFHEPLGAARILAAGEFLVVSNVGSGGDDGVLVDLEDVGHFSLDLEPLILSNNSASISMGATGLFNGVADSDLGSASLIRVDDDLQVLSDYAALGSDMIRVEVFDDGLLAGKVTVANGVVGTIQGLALICGCGKVPGLPPDPPCYVCELCNDAVFTAADSTVLVGDEIRLLAANASGPVDSLSSFSLTAANIDTFTITGESTVNSVVLDADFDIDTELFLYVDDAFGTAQPAYADGGFLPSGGFTGGGLSIHLGGIDNANIFGMSGAWQRSFTLEEPQAVTLSLRYNLTQAPSYEATEFSDALVEVDGVRLGSGGVLARLTGDGNGGSAPTTGWTRADLDVGTLAAGTHILSLGAFNNRKTFNDESTQLLIDDVVLTATDPVVCDVAIDFENGAAGWLNDGASTCTTGSFVVATPTAVTNGGVTTQVGGDHGTGAGNALFTATNTTAGADDVDGGNCILTSPTFAIGEASDVSIWYFHGQRDAGDDTAGDFFALEISTNAGASFSTLASVGDATSNAVWTEATTTVPAGSNVIFRVQVSDGPATGDLIEAGVDDLEICRSR